MEACWNKKNTVELIYSEPMHETSSARISIKVQEGNSRKSPNSNTSYSIINKRVWNRNNSKRLRLGWGLLSVGVTKPCILDVFYKAGSIKQ